MEDSSDNIKQENESSQEKFYYSEDVLHGHVNTVCKEVSAITDMDYK
jgi:hypothetical protein